MSSSATSLPAPPSSNGSWGKVGMGVGSFFLLWVFLWVLFYSFRPSVVCFADDYWPRPVDGCLDYRPADGARCLVASLVLTIVIFIVVWLIAAAR